MNDKNKLIFLFYFCTIVFLFFKFYLPTQNNVYELIESIEKTEKNIQQLLNYTDYLNKLSLKSVADLEYSSEKAFARQIKKMMDESRVVLVKENLDNQGRYRLTVSGDFLALFQFYHKIDKIDKLVVISYFSFSGKENSMNLTLDLKINFKRQL